MSKKMIWALVILALVVIVLVINHDKTDVNLIFTSIKAMKSFVFLGFTAVGVVIGILLK